jgi:ABC-type dipeptide/oligopeptide/nickel transport system permease component
VSLPRRLAATFMAVWVLMANLVVDVLNLAADPRITRL